MLKVFDENNDNSNNDNNILNFGFPETRAESISEVQSSKPVFSILCTHESGFEYLWNIL